MANGVMANINQQIDFDTAAIVAAEMGYEATLEAAQEVDEEKGEIPLWRQMIADEDTKDLVVRPPVVTILGHVDHGKTTLLDAIRHTNVAEGEAGGITQHIGAYQVELNGRTITFLDTPGHAAFTAMRARGAQGADIVVLVVAADDGVMPQTREAIAHGKAAQVPIIVAMNKIDKSNADRERVKQQLAEVGLVPDDWDGDTIVVPISAKKQQGLEDLLEAILLVADNMDIRANPKGHVIGTVIEAERDRAKGVMATLLGPEWHIEGGRCGDGWHFFRTLESHVRLQWSQAPQSRSFNTGFCDGIERCAPGWRAFPGGRGGTRCTRHHPGTAASGWSASRSREDGYHPGTTV